MDKIHYEEMVCSLNKLIEENAVQNKRIYLFGHCNATEELVDLLLENNIPVVAILDNNRAKHDSTYREITIKAPKEILKEQPDQTIVCIVARAYAAMAKQLKQIGYKGDIRRLVDYNSFAEYSLYEDTVVRMRLRAERGRESLQNLEQKYPGCFKLFCPFSSLGDVFIMMSYLPWFLQKRKTGGCVICVIGNACAQVAQLFGVYNVEIYSQNSMDEMVQAVLYTNDTNAFIAHQDRPYVITLHKALHIKCIPLEQIYCCGVFGLPADTEPYKPGRLQQYSNLEAIKQGNAVILSPYAKSVTSLPETLWNQITDSFLQKGYQCFTNVTGDEPPLANTLPLSPRIDELQSVVEYAGIFIGIRSGICDVLKYAKCKKTALYPDYYYCDTKWKAIDMYALDGWENIVVRDGFEWKIS